MDNSAVPPSDLLKATHLGLGAATMAPPPKNDSMLGAVSEMSDTFFTWVGRQVNSLAAPRHRINQTMSFGIVYFRGEVTEEVALPGTRVFKRVVEEHATRKKYSKDKIWAFGEGTLEIGLRKGVQVEGPVGISGFVRRTYAVSALMAHDAPDGNVLKIGRNFLDQIKASAKSIPGTAEGLAKENYTPGTVLIFRDTTTRAASVNIGKLVEGAYLQLRADVGVSGSMESEKLKLVERLDGPPGSQLYRIKLLEDDSTALSTFIGARANLSKDAIADIAQRGASTGTDLVGIPNDVAEPVTSTLTKFLGSELARKRAEVSRTGITHTGVVSDTEAVLDARDPNQAALYDAIIHSNSKEAAELLRTAQVATAHRDGKYDRDITSYRMALPILGSLFESTRTIAHVKDVIERRVPGAPKPMRITLDSQQLTDVFGGGIPEALFGMNNQILKIELGKQVSESGVERHAALLNLQVTDPKLTQAELGAFSKLGSAFNVKWTPPTLDTGTRGLWSGSMAFSAVLEEEQIQQLMRTSPGSFFQQMGRVQAEFEGKKLSDRSQLAPWASSADVAAKFKKDWVLKYDFSNGDARSDFPKERLETTKQVKYGELHPKRDVEKDIAVFKACERLTAAIKAARGQSVERSIEIFEVLADLDIETLLIALTVIRRLSGARLSSYRVNGDGFKFEAEPEIAPEKEHAQKVSEAMQLPSPAK